MGSLHKYHDLSISRLEITVDKIIERDISTLVEVLEMPVTTITSLTLILNFFKHKLGNSSMPVTILLPLFHY